METKTIICPKSVAVYCIQMVIISTVVIAAIINLSYKTNHVEVWISLLARTLGYVLPNPKLCKPTHVHNSPDEADNHSSIRQ